MVHILLKPSLKGFEHNLASMWNECNGTVVWTFFGIALLWNWNKNWSFPFLWPLWAIQICWHVEYSTLTASSFKIWDISAEIPSPSLALFLLILPKSHLTSLSRMSNSRWVTTALWLSGSLRPFLHSFSMFSCYLFLISFASVGSLWFVSFFMPTFAWNILLISPIFLKRYLVFPILEHLLNREEKPTADPQHTLYRSMPENHCTIQIFPVI